jgi:endonuclease YncB( thermonuclease family)
MSKIRLVTGICIIIIVVCLATVGLFLILQNETKGDNQNPPQQTFSEPNNEVEGTLNHVVDGDTIHLDVVENNIRFARIDAPESGESGYYEAKYLVSQLITEGDNYVYLDVDNQQPRDIHGRLVAVVSVVIDNKLVNVNAEVLRWGMANYPNHDWLKYVNDYPSEFNYQEWLASDYPYLR